MSKCKNVAPAGSATANARPYVDTRVQQERKPEAGPSIVHPSHLAVKRKQNDPTPEATDSIGEIQANLNKSTIFKTLKKSL